MTRAPTLDYSASQLPSSRYEWEMESERLRWLRRRFNWFCLVSGGLTLIFFPAQAFRYYLVDGWHAVSAATDMAHAIVYCSVLGFGWWYARRRMNDERYITRLATLIVITVGLLGLLATRVSLEFQLWGNATDAMSAAGAAAAEDDRRLAAPPPRR